MFASRIAAFIVLLVFIPSAARLCAAQNKTINDSAKQLFTTRTKTKILPPTKEENVFHFAVYGDRTGGIPAGLEVLKQAVVDTNLLDPDIVMTVGDLIQGYNETPEWIEQMKEYQTIMGRLNMRWFPVAGNHDVYWRGEGPAPAGQHDANYEKHFGPLWYSFRHKNAGFIVLYSDEGDPETNEKSFSEGRLQNMSDEQLAFLDQALKQLADADHVFCFLHHPRWIGGGYTGGNWELVHKKLANAGNVSAVFAGHIHHMRYDGVVDGIEYHTLATTGGFLEGDIPDAGFLHHLNLVTVRPDRFMVSALPVGAVFDPKDFTPELLAEVETARSLQPEQTSKPLLIKANGAATGDVIWKLKNPAPRPVSVTATFDAPAGQGNWYSSLSHEHFELAAGEERELAFHVRRQSGNSTALGLPVIRLQLDYLAEKARIRLPEFSAAVKLQPDVVPVDYFTNRENQCLVVRSPNAAVRIDSNKFQLPNGAFTLEAWVKPIELAGFNAIIAKTQGSEFAFFSDEGVPKFDVNLNGQYYSALSKEKLSTEQWTHLAGVFDGKQVTLYVNGKSVDSIEATGRRRRNRLPLYIGADPDQAGNPTRSFNGMIDEVRLSKAAIYQSEFEPAWRLEPTKDSVLLLHFDDNLGPFVLDHSSSAAAAILGSESQLSSLERPNSQ